MGYRDMVRENRLWDCKAKVEYRFRYTSYLADCIEQEKPLDEQCPACHAYSSERLMRREEVERGS